MPAHLVWRGCKALCVPLLAVLAVPSASFGQSAQLTPQQMFALSEDLLGQGRQSDAETLLIAVTRDASPTYRSEARFRLAMLRERRGDLAGAASLYRQILDDEPHAQRVRLELARVLALMGEETSARRELRRAGAVGLPDDVARVVDQFALALRSRRRVGGSIEVALAPSSNINRATSQNEIDTVLGPLVPSDDAQAKSGVGLSLGAQGFWRSDNSEHPLLVRMSGRGDIYGESSFNDVLVSGAAGPEFRGGRSRWRPAVAYSVRWFGNDLYSKHMGGALNWLRTLDTTSQLEVEGTVNYARYEKIRTQNGVTVDLQANYDRAIGQDLSVRASARATRIDAKDEALSYTSGSLSGLVAKRIGRQTLYAELSTSHLQADTRALLFPQRRVDWRFDATLGLLLTRWRVSELSPFVRIRQVFNRSTVDLYRFEQTRLEFGLSREL